MSPLEIEGVPGEPGKETTLTSIVSRRTPAIPTPFQLWMAVAVMVQLTAYVVSPVVIDMSAARKTSGRMQPRALNADLPGIIWCNITPAYVNAAG